MKKRNGKPVTFTVEKKIVGSLARAGKIHTAHGVIETPAFVAVGTKAAVRGLTTDMLHNIGVQAVLANTYHLYLQPGEEKIHKMGGVRGMMNWRGPTMTDSGGFQAFSLGVAYGEGISKFIAASSPLPEIMEDAYNSARIDKKARITEDGVEFKSVIDGSTHFLSPERSMEIQHAIGADIMIAFDECTSPHATYEYLKSAMNRTNRWAERSLDAHRLSSARDRQGLFGVVQGGRYRDLREKSAKTIGSMDFDGFAIGGSFVKEDMEEAVRWVNKILPEDKPRHLLGVGEPEDLLLGVENGCDTFDCVLPTRLGRHGTVYTKNGKIHISNTKYQEDLGPIENDCVCYACKNHSLAYISHLYRSREMLGPTLCSIHNLHFIVRLVSDMRAAILAGNFQKFKSDFLAKYNK